MKNPKPLHSVTFVRDGHLYIDDRTGQVIESRSRLLYDEGFGWDGPEGDHTARGTYVHDCNAALIDEDLDDSSVPAEFQGYVTALQSFHRDYRDRMHILAVEIPLIVPSWGYGVTPDMVALMDLGPMGSHRLPIELKTGSDLRVDLQLAAQIIAWNENFPDTPLSPIGACLRVRPDGTYRCNIHHPLDEAIGDFSAIVRVHQRRRREKP